MIRPVSIVEIRRLAAGEWGIGLADLGGPRRDRAVLRPRQAAMWLAARITGKSSSTLARYFARDPSTVRHAIRLIDQMRRQDIALSARLSAIERRIARRSGLGRDPMELAGAENRAGPALPLVMPRCLGTPS